VHLQLYVFVQLQLNHTKMRKPLDDEQFDYMIDFAIRALNNIYYQEVGIGRTPLKELRLKIKNKIKRLNQIKKK